MILESNDTNSTIENNELIVSTLEDENDTDFSAGDLSVREAISNSESGDNITFDSNLSGGTINLSLGELVIDKNLTIQGLGANNLIIDAGGNSRIFNVDDGNADIQSNVNISDLSITGGNVDLFSETPPANTNDGGGIINSENLEINNTSIYNNFAFFSGGGIANSIGTLTVNNSAIYDNSVGGAAFGTQGGGIANSGTANINQSTISNNETGSRSSGGGIRNNGTLNVINTTVSGNRSGGIFNAGESTVTSSIVAGNVANNDLEGNDFISGGNNLIGGEDTDLRVQSAGGFINGENQDIVGSADAPIDPLLGELQDNGGVTPTQTLLEGSPAIDVGINPNDLETDQRGEGFIRNAGENTDIGAFEVQETSEPNPNPIISTVVTTLDDEDDGDLSDGDISLREAIINAESGNNITFDSNLSGGTINLSLGELVIDKNLEIRGLGANNLTIDAGGTSRIFNVDDDSTDTLIDVQINDLTIRGGNVNSPEGGFSGGGIQSAENLEINGANIHDNSAFGGGGGIHHSEGTLTINNSSIHSNSGGLGGMNIRGGGIVNSGTATINQSTISNNSAGFRSAGGGILNGGTLDIANSTVSGNASGGIFNEGESTVTSTIIAANINSTDVEGNDFTSGGNNLIGIENLGSVDSASGFTNGENGDIVGTSDNPIDPLLGELQNNGGATPTQALLEGSIAIGAGSNPNNLTTDQRGEGFDRTSGNSIDIGAYEIQDDNGGGNTELVVSTLEDENDGDFSEGDLSLREAIILANENVGDDTINFDGSLNGGTITFNESQERNLTIDESVSIEGLGQDNLTLDGGFIFDISQEVTDARIDGLNLTGGKIDSFGDFSLSNSKISQTIETGSDNSAVISRGRSSIFNSTITDNNGGSNVGILVESGTLNIEGSEVTDNSAVQAQSGIIVGSEGTTNITNSTIANNQARSIAGISNNGRLNITNSTIVSNSGGLNGGGIVNSASANLISNIVANNVGGENIGDVSGSGEFVSSGNNLIGNGDDATGFVDGKNNDLVGTKDALIDPQLGELQNNGGITKTFAPEESSLAIDAGNASSSLLTDQRGEEFARLVGTNPDIGAFELQTSDNGDGGDGDVDNSDDDNTIATANNSGIIPEGQQNVFLNNAISPDSDVDLFKLELQAEDVTTFNIEAREFGSSLDSVLRIFDSEGNEVARDDDSNAPFEASNFDSYIEFTADTDGEYYVGVSSFNNFDYDPINGGNENGLSSGEYDLAISVFNGIDGTSEADSLNGTSESDFLKGFDGNDRLAGEGGRDNLLGGSGNDVLTGGDGDDLLRGEAGDDFLRGGNGNDTFGGGAGSNRLTSGAGNDIFAIGSGQDFINDFQDGSDKLLLTGNLEFVEFENLTISASGSSTTIGNSSNTFATLTGVSPDQITSDDFVFPDILAANFRVESSSAK